MIKVVHLIPDDGFLAECAKYSYILDSKDSYNYLIECNNPSSLTRNQINFINKANILINHCGFDSHLIDNESFVKGIFIHRSFSEKEIALAVERKFDFYIFNSGYKSYAANHKDKNIFSLQEYFPSPLISGYQAEEKNIVFGFLTAEGSDLEVMLPQVKEKIDLTGKNFQYIHCAVEKFSVDFFSSCSAVILDPLLFKKNHVRVTLNILYTLLFQGKTLISCNLRNIKGLIIHEETGIILPDFSLSHLSHACHFLISFPGVFRTISDSIRKYFSSFTDKDLLLSEYDALIREIYSREIC